MAEIEKVIDELYRLRSHLRVMCAGITEEYYENSIQSVDNTIQTIKELQIKNDELNEWCKKVVREVTETEDAFIFSAIKPFINSITTMEISKEELVRAIHLVRMQREASERFGVLISSDWDTATAQMHDLNEAFMKGFEAGSKKEKDKIKEILDD